MRRLLLGFTALVCALAALVSVAEAKGTVRVQQSDGAIQVYSDVGIRIVGQTLRLTSADGKGTLVITKAACSFQGDLMVCLPYSAELDQNGQLQTLDFHRGTVYLNQTGAKLNLPLSSTVVPPNGVVGSLTSQRGTIISITGVIDGKTP